MSILHAKAGDLVERFMDEAMSSGLSWDEAVAVFGFAAKAAAQAAAMAGEGDISECVALARRRFEDAFAQEVRVIVADPDSAMNGAAGEENALLATAHRRHVSRPH